MVQTFKEINLSPFRQALFLKRCLGALIVLSILGFVIFRANVQSIVHDEAVTYNLFVAPGLPTIFLTFNSNNHTLNTFLMWLSSAIFGLSVLNLRLPALIGGLIYLIAAERICNLAFKNTLHYALALLTLTTSPFILDFMTIARGYSLALGFFLLAILYVWKQTNAQPAEGFRYEILISILTALSVSANLSFAFANTGLLLAYACLLAIRFYRKELAGKQLLRKYLALAVPGGLLYLIITPFSFAFSSETLYFGTGSWHRTFDSIMTEFFDGFRPSLLTGNWRDTVGNLVQYLPYGFIVLVIMGAWLLVPKYIRHLRSSDPLEPADSLWVLVTLNLSFTFLLLSAARLLFGALLPRERTGIYFVPLVVLIACLLVASLQKPGIQKILAGIGQLFLTVVIVYFGLCAKVSNTRLWVNDLGTETTFKVLLSTLKQYPDAKVAANWVLEPGLNFYRTLYHADSLNRFTRRAAYDEFQLLILLPRDKLDQQYKSTHQVKVLYTNPESGAAIVLNKQSTH